MTTQPAGVVFIAYAAEDRVLADSMRGALVRCGVPVWWDVEILKGDFGTAIQQAIRGAACIVPLWTKHSVESTWVRDEVRFANEVGKAILGVRYEDVIVPVGFGQSHFIDLAREPTGTLKVAAACERILAAVAPVESEAGDRAIALPKGKQLPLPCFVRSTSSHETILAPESALGVLQAFGGSAALVSAYDVAHSKHRRRLVQTAGKIRSGGGVLFLDSGNYEAFRKHDHKWTERSFEASLKLIPADLVFCFDNIAPALSVRALTEDVIRRFRRAQSLVDSPVIPIVHIPKDTKGRFKTGLLPEIFAKLSATLQPIAIAVPERELGDGLTARARNVWSIREALRVNSRYQPIHLLGTGNPLSIATLVAVGADLFDGLEWCRTVADESTKLLYHPQQFDFFSYQTRLAEHAVVRQSVDDQSLPYGAKIAFHNLSVFEGWMTIVREHALARTLDRLLTGRLPEGAFDDLAKSVPQAFKR